jgi:O-acetyl-ADP-ribose deacetylase (regulator of RNase III)
VGYEKSPNSKTIQRTNGKVYGVAVIEFVKGDILDAKEKYIAHQTNSVSNQAAGLAHHIFLKYPYANIYSHRPYPYKATGQDLPGHCVIRGDGLKDRLIVAIMGQYFPGSPKSQTSLLDSSIVREGYFNRCLVELSHMNNIESIAFPKNVGCGLAGGNWTNYLRMLEAFAIGLKQNQGARVVVYDND